MFGHDKSDDNDEPATVAPTIDDTSSAADDTTAPAPDAELTLPAPATDDVAVPGDTPASSVVADEPVSALPTFTDNAAVEPAQNAGEPITISGAGKMSDLTALRQEALHELSPLIGQLDQTPDEKYATAKMVFEETKDQALLASVYEAAKNLTDEKAKAEAIYDVIQKINDLK
jgi:hypothetical protein